jgi:hypothetical protein
MDRRLASAEDQ